MNSSSKDAEPVQSTVASSFDEDLQWEILAEILEQFCQFWTEAPPEPEIEDFANQIRSRLHSQFCRTALCELVKVEFENRNCVEFEWKPVEWYLEKFPELSDNGNPPTDLIYEELHIRKSSDETIQVGEYAERFPNGYEALAKLVQSGTAHSSAMSHTLHLNQFAAGHTVDDFDLLSKLGRGGFAVVFLARQNSMQRLVALKISANKGLEGQTLAQLDHPHIVRVYDQRALSEPNVRLMYMEYIAGASISDLIKESKSCNQKLAPQSFLNALDHFLKNSGQSPPIESLNRNWITEATWARVVSRIGNQLASALGYAHKQGVLHRDLKPANVLVNADGYPKLVDFNVSFGSQVVGATATSQFGGSLAYMSPEQLEAFGTTHSAGAEDLTEKSDIYSLGILLYELLIGERPFVDPSVDNRTAMIDEYLEQRVSGLSYRANRNLESNGFLISNAIRSSLEPKPENRPTAFSLARQLKWSENEDIESYLRFDPAKTSWRNWAAKFPFVACLIVWGTIAFFATWFIVSYNLVESVAEGDRTIYTWIRRAINLVVFNGGLYILYLLFRDTWMALKEINSSETQDSSSSDKRLDENVQLERVTTGNFRFGHHCAIFFATAWSVAGVMYPVTLTISGASLGTAAWADFIGSHILAGLLTASYVFCAITCFSLAVWHPKLMMSCMGNDSEMNLESEIKATEKRLKFYQGLAVATPLLAIALLVVYREGTNTFALAVLSIAALTGLALLGWTSNQIQKALDTIEGMEN